MSELRVVHSVLNTFSSAIVELFELLEGYRSRVVLVTSSHDISDILLCHRMIQIVSEDLLEVIWLDKNAFVTVEHFESGQKFTVCAAALVPAEIDNFFEVVSGEASASVVVAVPPLQLLFFLPLADTIEAKVVYNALEITPADKFITASEILKRVRQVTLHVRW